MKKKGGQFDPTTHASTFRRGVSHEISSSVSVCSSPASEAQPGHAQPKATAPPDRARAAGSTRRMERTEEVSGNVGCQKHHPGACVKRCETTQRSAVTDPRSEKTSRRTGPKASWRRPNQKHIKGVLAHQTAETGRLGQHTFAKRALI